VSTDAEDDWRYWKAAISCLPTQETRDAAWEFFVRHFSQNPKMADTLSGLILVMQANGLYMLDAPKIVREQTIDPLNDGLARFRQELDRAMGHEKQMASEISQAAQTVLTAVKALDEVVRNGWREVNAAKLAEEVHAELEETLFQPIALQCRLLEHSVPALKEAVAHTEESTRRLRSFHFKGIFAAMLVICFVVAGGLLAYSWWKLARHYELKLSAALERMLSVNAKNQETFTQLTKMNVPIRVVPVIDNRKQTIPGKFALVVDRAEDVGIEDIGDGKRAAIYFQKSFY
jgi:hypothetical protein